MTVKRLKVYVSGPIQKGCIKANISQASMAGMRLLKAGFAPLVPHLSCYLGETCDPDRVGAPQPEVLPHGTSPEDWYEADLPWVEAADAVLRLPGESRGADLEVGRANEFNIPVFHTMNELMVWGIAALTCQQGRMPPSPELKDAQAKCLLGLECREKEETGQQK